jgi:ABC-type glutathione transport system ATPase component
MMKHTHTRSLASPTTTESRQPKQVEANHDDEEERASLVEAIRIRHADFVWDASASSSSSSPPRATLHGIHLAVRHRELLAVVGRVGAGKSSLLSAILGEMEPSDAVTVNGRIAYVNSIFFLFFSFTCKIYFFLVKIIIYFNIFLI